MRIAKWTTIKNNKKTRISYAYSALERATLEKDGEELEKADKAFDKFLARKMPIKEQLDWALTEWDYRMTVY